MTGTRASWESSFPKAGEELRVMESDGDVRLFSSGYPGFPADAWHVWAGDRRLYCGGSEDDAYKAFREETGEGWS